MMKCKTSNVYYYFIGLWYNWWSVPKDSPENCSGAVFVGELIIHHEYNSSTDAPGPKWLYYLVLCLACVGFAELQLCVALLELVSGVMLICYVVRSGFSCLTRISVRSWCFLHRYTWTTGRPASVTATSSRSVTSAQCACQVRLILPALFCHVVFNVFQYRPRKSTWYLAVKSSGGLWGCFEDDLA